MNYIEFKAIKKLNNLYAKLKSCELGFIDKYGEYDNVSKEIRNAISYLHKNCHYIKPRIYYRIMRQLRRINKLKTKLYYRKRKDILMVIKYKEMIKKFDKV